MALYFLSLLRIPNIKVQRFSSLNKKVGGKSSNNLITANTDIAPHHIQSAWKICWASNCLQSHYHSIKEVIEKVFKSMLCSLLGRDVHVVQQITAPTNPKVVIINGMAVLHITNSCGADTFGELFEKYSTSSVPHSFTTTVCKSTWSLTTQIGGPVTPVPGQ